MKYCRLLIVFLAYFTALFLSPASANDGAPTYEHSAALQVMVEREVTHDLMRVVLYSEEQDSNPARLADRVTKILNEAIIKIRAAETIAVQLGSRGAYPIHDKEGKNIIAWREHAHLQLESSDFVALSALSSQLIGDLKIAERGFTVSKARRKEVENELMIEAIEEFKKQAWLVTKALGGKAYKIDRLSFEPRTSGVMPFMRQRVVEMAISDSNGASFAPEIEAGSSEIAIATQGMIVMELPLIFID